MASISGELHGADSGSARSSAEPLVNNNGHQTHEPEREGAGEAGGKQTVSSRKIEANRRNAREGQIQAELQARAEDPPGYSRDKCVRHCLTAAIGRAGVVIRPF